MCRPGPQRTPRDLGPSWGAHLHLGGPSSLPSLTPAPSTHSGVATGCRSQAER